jgi:hypothetical protein
LLPALRRRLVVVDDRLAPRLAVCVCHLSPAGKRVKGLSPMTVPLPLWSRALRARALRRVEHDNRAARARLVLASMLERAGFDVGVATIHTWSRPMQGAAYLWALAFLEGREDVPPPRHVFEACR